MKLTGQYFRLVRDFFDPTVWPGWAIEWLCPGERSPKELKKCIRFDFPDSPYIRDLTMPFFRNKKKKEPEAPVITDLSGVPIEAGARVQCLRYELGESIVELEGREYFYVSVATGQRVSYVRMFDASTQNQKVKVIRESQGN